MWLGFPDLARFSLTYYYVRLLILTVERSAFELQGNIWKFLSDLHWRLVGLLPTVLVYFTKEPNGTSARIWTQIDGFGDRSPTIGRHWYKIKRRWYIIPVHNYNNLDIVILRGGVIKRPCTREWWIHMSIWIYNCYKSCHNLFSFFYLTYIL